MYDSRDSYWTVRDSDHNWEELARFKMQQLESCSDKWRRTRRRRSRASISRLPFHQGCVELFLIGTMCVQCETAGRSIVAQLSRKVWGVVFSLRQHYEGFCVWSACGCTPSCLVVCQLGRVLSSSSILHPVSRTRIPRVLTFDRFGKRREIAVET